MALSIKKRWKILTTKPGSEPEKVFKMRHSEEFFQVKEILEKVQTMHPLDGIVLFFNTLSKLADRSSEYTEMINLFEEVNLGKYNEDVSQLRTFQKILRKVGRKPYGWNRTEVGQEVTENNVYLGGDVYGLNTKTVAYWKSIKDEKKGGWGYPHMEHLNPYDVISQHAKEFMDSWIPQIIEICQHFENKKY